jgi:thiaminase/transcriptional activator TenA
MRLSSAPLTVRPQMVEAYRLNGSLWERLKAACAEEWERYLENDFIWHLAEGSLSPEAYRHFIEQDYIYCINYARAYALAAYKAQSADDMQKSLATMSAVLDKELDLHRDCFREWGLTLEDVDRIPESNANVAYTRYILDCGMAGDVLDLHTALSPCVIGYAEVGTLLRDHERTTLDGNPFRDWIEWYSGDEYQSVAQAAEEHLDEVARDRLTEERFVELAEIFKKTVRLDIKFWEMSFGMMD